MTTESNKLVRLDDKRVPYLPSIDHLRALQPQAHQPFHNTCRGQDTLSGSSFRTLFAFGLNGTEEFSTKNGVNPNSQPTQNSPLNDAWRAVATVRGRYTPGCFAEVLILYLPSGMTQFFDGVDWEADGAGGAVRFGITFTKGATSTGPHYFSKELEPSLLQYGALPAGSAKFWPLIKQARIPVMFPPDFDTDAATAAIYSEICTYSMTVETQGGVRIIDCAVTEAPVRHAQAHGASLPAVHAFTIDGMHPPQTKQTPVPQVEAKDGASNSEGRFGTTQVVEVARRQGDILGPRGPAFTSWLSDDGSPAETAQIGISVTGTVTPVDIFDTTITSWSNDAPGFIVVGSEAQLHRWCDERLIMRGGRAVIPVRVWVRGKWIAGSGTAGTVRVQSSRTEWVELVFATDSTVQTKQMIGELECQVAGDQMIAVCQVFAYANHTTDSMTVYDVAVEFGDF